VASSYTETFLRLIGGGVTKTWIVPDKKRAVIKSFVICQRQAAPTLVQLYIANTVLYYREVPGVAATEIYSLTAVAYEGEEVGVYESNGGCHITVSGFLFTDLEGPGVPHGDFVHGESPDPPTAPELRPT
jgi:hypothetical protein